MQPLSHGWHTSDPSAYVPLGHVAMQLLPWRFGLLDAHVMQSVDIPPVHVVQSAWQLAQPPSESKSPSGHDEMQVLSYRMGAVSA